MLPQRLLWLLLLLPTTNSYRTSELEYCKSLGEYHYADPGPSKRYAAVQEVQTHVFQAPPPNQQLLLNVPAKSGNHNWGGLFYRLWYNEVPRNFSVVWDTIEEYSLRGNYSDEFSMWLITRSPYVRILSTYLEKIHCATSESSHHFHTGFGIFKELGRVTFEEFLINLVNRVIGPRYDSKRIDWSTLQPEVPFEDIHSTSSSTSSGSSSGGNGVLGWLFGRPQQQQQLSKKQRRERNALYAQQRYAILPDVDNRGRDKFNTCGYAMAKTELYSLIDPTGDVRKLKLPLSAELSPVERATRLCYLNHHFCVQAVGLFKQSPGRVRVLKLEHQGAWFRQFTRCFGIEVHDIRGVEWNEFSKQACFYTPSSSCADVLAVVDTAALIQDGVHGLGTFGRMNEHYTPLAAQLVNYLYEFDLNSLDYEKWDGTGHYSLH